MRCPECEFLFSDDFDLCPGCRSDVREFKRRLGLPVHFPDISYEALRTKLESKSGQLKKEAPAKDVEDTSKRLWKRGKKNNPIVQAADLKPLPIEDLPKLDAVPSLMAEAIPVRIFDRSVLLEGLGKYTYSAGKSDLFGQAKEEGYDVRTVANGNVTIVRQLPDLAEIQWRFEEIRREMRGVRREQQVAISKLETSGELLDHLQQAELNPSLVAFLPQIQVPLVKPSVRESLMSAARFALILFGIVMAALFAMRGFTSDLSSRSEQIKLLRDSVSLLFGVSWFFAFWPLLNNGKLVGGIYLVDEKGSKASLRKLFYRGVIYPPVFFLFLWPFGLVSGTGVHSKVMGLRTSTVHP